MCFPTFTTLGSLFLLFGFILELFILIGQLSNRVFLTDLFFGSAWNTGQSTRYNFALWNYCSGDLSGNINSCAHPTPAFNWATTPDLSNLLQAQASSGMVNNLFMAMFVLFFIACCWSFLIWLASIPICCFKRRVFGLSMAILVLINFFVLLVALILALVLVLSGVKLVVANAGWSAHAGNLLWITIGAVISLLLSSIFYSCALAGDRGKRRRVNPDNEDKGDDNPYYGSYLPHNPNQPLYATDQGYTTSQSAQHNPASQQYYQTAAAEPSAGQQGLSTDMGQHGMTSTHSDSAKVHQTHNDPAAAPYGYQTPTLQNANLP
ncbi:hypothetical protein G6F62_002604 [Rhizopus arrhizus]|nr:hypothetical protein G6F62_002604 [Rhizopus arrhizus]KAG1378483.1 hypothetical protein G6F61_005794 [Rhizopus arrhizus]